MLGFAKLDEILLSAQVAGQVATESIDKANWFPCGRAHLIVAKPTGKGQKALITKLIAAGRLRASGWGLLLVFNTGSQSLAVYEAFVDAAKAVLTANGIDSHVHSYID